ncbi:MAG TPA: PCRF domain-containing protein, partial [Stellaceae bacterium]|nr:PCRF domain-containing protein [Stellaceae bacterium]
MTTGSLDAKLDRVVRRHAELGDTLARPDANPAAFGKLSKEYSDLTPMVEAIAELRNAERELKDLEALQSPDGDPELRELAQAEIPALKRRIPEIEQRIKMMLLPKDEADERNAILEVRAGTGGEEAALFAAVLFRMYQRYAGVRGWRFEVLDVSETGLGGLKEASAAISGRNVFERLKFESGVHRVQRVPETEGSGRIHTSAATVAVLPEAEEVDVHIEEKDLRIDVFRSSGPG